MADRQHDWVHSSRSPAPAVACVNNVPRQERRPLCEDPSRVATQGWQKFRQRIFDITKVRRDIITEYEACTQLTNRYEHSGITWTVAVGLPAFNYLDVGYYSYNEQQLQTGRLQNIIASSSLDGFRHEAFRDQINAAYHGETHPSTSVTLRLPAWEEHLEGDIPKCLFDLVRHWHYNYRTLLQHQKCVLYELVDVRSEAEAKLWHDIFTWLEQLYGMRCGTIRAYLTLDESSIHLAFQLERAVFQLREHFGRLRLGSCGFLVQYINQYSQVHENFELPLYVNREGNVFAQLEQLNKNVYELCERRKIPLQPRELSDFLLLPIPPPELDFHPAPAPEPNPRPRKQARQAHANPFTIITQASRFMQVCTAQHQSSGACGFITQLQLPWKQIAFYIRPADENNGARVVEASAHAPPVDLPAGDTIKLKYGVVIDEPGFSLSKDLDKYFVPMHRKKLEREAQQREKKEIDAVQSDYSPATPASVVRGPEVVVQSGSRNAFACQFGLVWQGAAYIISGPRMHYELTATGPQFYYQQIEKTPKHAAYRALPVVYRHNLPIPDKTGCI